MIYTAWQVHFPFILFLSIPNLIFPQLHGKLKLTFRPIKKRESFSSDVQIFLFFLEFPCICNLFLSTWIFSCRWVFFKSQRERCRTSTLSHENVIFLYGALIYIANSQRFRQVYHTAINVWMHNGMQSLISIMCLDDTLLISNQRRSWRILADSFEILVI